MTNSGSLCKGEEYFAYLLECVRMSEKNEYTGIIVRERTWEALYHLSPLRENILNWYPFTKQDDVLELYAECGAVTGAVIDRVHSVTVMEESGIKRDIIRQRHRNANNLEVVKGTPTDVSKQYDYVILYDHIDEIDTVKLLLKRTGKIILVFANRIGIKYFAGEKELGETESFTGIEGRNDLIRSKSFLRREITERLKEAGFNDIVYYYPFPDHIFPERIFSDSFLPNRGELVINLRNFENSRWMVFDESKAFDTIMDAGLFQEMTNSFLVVAGIGSSMMDGMV